jgi:hypothetical protein
MRSEVPNNGCSTSAVCTKAMRFVGVPGCGVGLFTRSSKSRTKPCDFNRNAEEFLECRMEVGGGVGRFEGMENSLTVKDSFFVVDYMGEGWCLNEVAGRMMPLIRKDESRIVELLRRLETMQTSKCKTGLEMGGMSEGKHLWEVW